MERFLLLLPPLLVLEHFFLTASSGWHLRRERKPVARHPQREFYIMRLIGKKEMAKHVAKSSMLQNLVVFSLLVQTKRLHLILKHSELHVVECISLKPFSPPSISAILPIWRAPIEMRGSPLALA